MAAKSPTLSVKSREIIGVDQFSQRREVFDKHDTVFLPPSPTSTAPVYREVEPILTSNHGKTTAYFKRNTPGYSSMRESRTEERVSDFRPRKYSDNFTSELNQSDDVEYRHTMTERTRRLSKLRRDFMTSNLHEPGSNGSFNRSGTRASLPAHSSPMKYKIESPNLYKFPFAEPYTTPTPVRREFVDLGPIEIDGEGKENQENVDPEKTRHHSLMSDDSPTKIDRQKIFEQLVKRYSPQRKPVDWQLPPTKPRVIASVPKSGSSLADSIDSGDRRTNEKLGDDDVFEKNQTGEDNVDTNEIEAEKLDEEKRKSEEDMKPNVEIILNGSNTSNPETSNANSVSNEKDRESDPKALQNELDETNDQVPELSEYFPRQNSKGSAKLPPLDTVVDLSIPALIEKMTVEGEDLENNKKGKKVKRKRSFLDKLLGRKKELK